MVFLITLIASSVGMNVRQEIGHLQFNPLIYFAATAFVTSVISAQAVIFQLGNKPLIVMASSVLMLVPGFPLINAVVDMLKGYINMGIARFVMASLVTKATAQSIVAAMSITGIWGGNVKLGAVFGPLNDMFCRDSGGWFALVFNVPVPALKYCALCGALGHGSPYLMMHFGVSIEWACFLSPLLWVWLVFIGLVVFWLILKCLRLLRLSRWFLVFCI